MQEEVVMFTKPRFEKRLTFSIQEYLNLIRTCKHLRGSLAKTTESLEAEQFFASSLDVILAEVTEGTDAHLCSLIKKEQREVENDNQTASL